jgi:hypothetical protein
MSRSDRLLTRVLCAALGFAAFAAPASAEVDIRMLSRPLGEPITAFVNVTDGFFPVGELEFFELSATIDGTANNGFAFTTAPMFDPAQRISVVFAIDYSADVQGLSGDAIQAGISTFISQMTPGDYAAIVKFNDTNGATLVQPFTEIDGGSGSSLLLTALADDYEGDGTNLLEALGESANEFTAKAGLLPPGAKAVIVVSAGDDDFSGAGLSELYDTFNAGGIAVFTVSAGDISGDAAATALMTALAGQTGGRYIAAPDDAGIETAYITARWDLWGSYVLTWPADTVTDCNAHTLQLLATGFGAFQVGNVEFTHCDDTPADFQFVDQTGVEPGVVVVSNTVTITGIDQETGISVSGGEYSIGCGATFTAAPGTISVDDEVCVRHTAAAGFQQAAGPTVLVVGGVSSSFTSTTRAAAPPPPPPGGGGGGGGGAAGLLELLLALGGLLARRRLAA